MEGIDQFEQNKQKADVAKQPALQIPITNMPYYDTNSGKSFYGIDIFYPFAWHHHFFFFPIVLPFVPEHNCLQ
mgnify:CR=1 FL=1